MTNILPLTMNILILFSSGSVHMVIMMLMLTILLVFSLMVDAPLVTRLIPDVLWYHPCAVPTASNVASLTELCLCGILYHLMYVILLITLLLYPV